MFADAKVCMGAKEKHCLLKLKLNDRSDLH